VSGDQRGHDRKAFWEHKILGWEEGRYRRANAAGGLLERIADWSSDSLRFRLQITGELLAPYVRDRHVVDVGCGSALLAPAILQAGAASYHGFDLAEAAVRTGRERAAAWGYGERLKIDLGAVGQLPDVPRDLVVSLGLTDWLTDEELGTLFAWSGRADFLHALSEQRASPAQWLHRAYCWVAYGYRTAGYVPRYFTVEHLASLAAPHRQGPCYVYRHPRLSFGALLSSLPVGPAVAGG
jgi:SAM-dependent methyltransferase